MVHVLGLDPGLRHTGWGIVCVKGNSLHYVASGVVNAVQQGALAERLLDLFTQLTKVLSEYLIDEAAVEETFVNKNPASTLKLGMARGVVLLTPAYLGKQVFEYSANHVKKAVVGAGHADKNQVLAMIRFLLPTVGDKLKADAADALAVAICHAHSRKTQQWIKQ